MLVENGFDSEDEAPPCNVAPVNGENDPLVSDDTMIVENGFDSEDEAPPCDLIIGSRIDSADDEDIPEADLFANTFSSFESLATFVHDMASTDGVMLGRTGKSFSRDDFCRAFGTETEFKNWPQRGFFY